MAGFDFYIEAQYEDRRFLQSLLRLAQRLAGKRGVRFSYRWKQQAGYFVIVDGSLTSMQYLLEPLVIGLFSYAEGAVSFGPNQYRQDIAHRVTSSYANSLDEITETVEHISETFDGMPNSLSFDVGGATHLSGHINAFSNSLTLYYQGRILPHQIAEDAHTIIELLLRDVLGSSSNKLSFEEKVQSAEDKGCFDQKLAVALVQLKNLRRDAKHRGQGISNKVIDRLLPPVITASHRLARIIRNDFES